MAVLDADHADKATQDFAFVEHREASAAYFHGVGVGYTVVKNYITVNALLIVLIGALATVEVKNPVLPSPIDVVRVVPWIAVTISLALALLLPQYWAHQKNCRDRCIEIESQYEGQLFTRLAKVESSGWFRADTFLMLMIIIVLLLWLLFAFRDWIPAKG